MSTNQETIHDYKQELAKIKDHLIVIVADIRSFERTYGNLDTQKCNHWLGQIPRLQSEVRNHRDGIIAKVIEIKASVDNSAYDSIETRKLDLKERQVAAQEALVTSNTNQTMKEADDKRSNALVEAKTKSESIKADVEELDKIINETTDWKNATDIVVKKAMRNIEKWISRKTWMQQFSL